MKTTQILYIFLLIILNACAEKSVCEEYKKGDFYEIIVGNENINKKITRTENSEISVIVKRNGKTTKSNEDYRTIEWINDCDYILKIDESKMEMDESMYEINRNGGILCEFEKTENEYLIYNCTIKLDNEIVEFKQKIRIE